MKHPIDKLSRTVNPKSERVKFALENPIMIQRELNNRSLFEFIQCFWEEYSNDMFVPNWHIPYLCKELEHITYRVANKQEREYDLIINIPPGTTKTALVSIFWPLWVWTKYFWMKWITSSYSGILSMESAEYSRDIMKSEKFRLLYPELDIKADKDTKTNFKVIKKSWDNPNVLKPRILYGGNRFSTSVGGTVTGFHGHINLIDDPIDPNGVLSDKERDGVNHWCSQVLPLRKADKRSTVTVLVMQRLHQNDPSGYMLAQKGRRLKHICLPGECKTFGDLVSPPSLKKYYTNNLFDPVRMPWSVLSDLKSELGQYGYAGQVGQKPTPPGGGMFHIDQLQKIMESPAPYSIEQIVRYWDKAATDKEGAYTAGVKLARLRGGKYIILDIKRGQWSTDKREKMILNTAQADGVHVHVYTEQEPGSGGKESALATKKMLEDNGFFCVLDRPQGQKIFRADPFSVQVNEGNVWLLNGDWNDDYTDEMEHFPYSTYKDQIDASSGAYSALNSQKEVIVL